MSSILDIIDQPEGQPFATGVTVGIVTNNQDPAMLGRIKVQFSTLSDNNESNWARVVTPMAGKERGMWFLPEVGDEVLVGFLHSDVNAPYILGALWNGESKPLDVNEDGKNNIRMIKSRSGHTVRLDDTDGSEKIEIIDKSTKNSVTIDTASNTIEITADADIQISAAKGKLTLKGKGVAIQSSAEVSIEASQNMDLNAGPQMNIKGTMVNIN